MDLESNRPTGIWSETPLIYSHHISTRLNCDVYLKLENLQPSQSFKYRGISYFAEHCKKVHGASVHLIIASGGNAGLAAAFAAQSLAVKCTVYLPKGATKKILDFFEMAGAKVVIFGSYYLQALKRAEEAAKDDCNAVMVPAYDDEIVWKGHSSMIHEIKDQVPSKPDAIFCSVGGGGLLGGIIQGCRDVGWDSVPLVALETHGSACFYHSISMNEGKWRAGVPPVEGITPIYNEESQVKLASVDKITSRATSLGATSPAAGVVKAALQRIGPMAYVKVPDELSMLAIESFADDHKFLVELACATTLVPAYKPALFDKILGALPSASSTARKTVVLIVCGGAKISQDEIAEYKSIVEASMGDKETWSVDCNGEEWRFPK